MKIWLITFGKCVKVFYTWYHADQYARALIRQSTDLERYSVPADGEDSMISMTYGVMPKREDFQRAFERECPNGYHIVLSSSDSRAVDGFKLGDGVWSESDLWEAVNEIAEYHNLPSTVFLRPRGMYDPISAMDLVSSIMETLGFEWI